MVGAWLVNAMKSYFTVAAPELWLYVLGGTFIAVTLWLPRGVVGLRLPGLARIRRRGRQEPGGDEGREGGNP
jgi:urea transport system permease protein